MFDKQALIDLLVAHGAWDDKTKPIVKAMETMPEKEFRMLLVEELKCYCQNKKYPLDTELCTYFLSRESLREDLPEFVASSASSERESVINIVRRHKRSEWSLEQVRLK